MHTTYMLRRTLCTWNLGPLIAETVETCRNAGIDEIVWISESSGMYPELLTLEGIRKLIPGLQQARTATEAAGMRFSINPLTTLGHGEYGASLVERHPDMSFMVDISGKVSRACACPLSPYWRELMRETYRLYAETQPARLWIEDDFRYHNHGPIKLGCFCDLHLAAFAERTGKHYTCKELVERLLRPGPADPLRLAWMRFLGETLTETASLISRAVHAVSPEVQLGLMMGPGAVWEISGMDVGAVLRALADGGHAAIRMSTTSYHEQSARDLYTVDENLKRVLPLLPPGTVRCTEIETFPHSIYSKSAGGLAAQMTWAGLLGVPNHTLNLFDYLGSPMAQLPTYPAMLGGRKAEIDAFAGLFADADTQCGIGVPMVPMMSAMVQTRTGCNWHEWAVRENGWTTPLRAFGMPVVYANDQPVAALSGQSLRAFGRREIESLFARGVLLDGSALDVLIDMGYGHLAGVEIAERFEAWSRPIGAEELTDPDFGGAPHAYVWGSLLRPERVLHPLPGAQPISRILDPEGTPLFPGFVRFENALGGRVCVCPYDLGGSGLDPFASREPAGFYSVYRKRQLRAVVRWLARGAAPLTVDAEGWILPHRADAPGAICVAAMNLNDDPWETGLTFNVAVPRPVARIEWIDIDGQSHPLPPSACTLAESGEIAVTIETRVPPKRMVAARISLATRDDNTTRYRPSGRSLGLPARP